MRKCIILLVGLVCSAQVAYSQFQGRGYRVSLAFPYYNPKLSSFSWHGGFGFGAYSGDLSEPYDFGLNNNTLNINFTGGFSYRYTHFLSLRTELIRYTLRSSDHLSDRGFSFEAGNWELSAQLMIDAMPQWRIDTEKKKVQFYGFLGLGLTWFQPTTRGGTFKGVSADQDKANFPITPVIPVGGGIRFYPRNNFYIALEGGTRFAFTDYLDGVSKRASTLYNDGYVLYGFKLGWTRPFGFRYKTYMKRAQKTRNQY